MVVNLSPIWGAGAQLLDNSGNVLSGGKIYTYAAGTTTPAATYTSSNGITANSNPIILNSAGRVPYEIWLTDGVSYKFVLKDSNDVLIATYDNLTGINSNFIAYTSQQEIQTATAGQTVFNLTTMQYQPGTNNLSVFVDGVNQYGPGAQYAYVETDSDTVTFVSGLHVGASVKFTTATPVSSAATDAFNVSYTPPFAGSVATNVGDKLAQTVSVKDFGAVGDGVTDDTSAIQTALDSNLSVYFPAGYYAVTTISFDLDGQQVTFDNAYLQGIADTSTTAIAKFTAIQGRYDGLKVYGNYNLNYTSAVQITANSVSDYAARCIWTNLSVYAAKIGVLYGEVSSPVDAPVSENNIIGGEFRDVERCFFVKQPNGFCYVTNMVVDCQKYEWDTYHPGSFSYSVSAACEMEDGWMQFNNCSFIKAQTALGYLLICAGTVYNGTMTITGCHSESACTNFFGGDDGRYYIDGYRNNLFNNSTSAFIIFKSGSTGVFKATNLFYTRGTGGEAVTQGLINSSVAAQWNVSFTNGVFENQNMTALLDSDNHYSTQCTVAFKDCVTQDVTYGTSRLDTSAYTAVPALLNLPVSGVGSAPPSAQYQTATTGGSAITVQTDAGASFNQCIQMVSGASGLNQLVTYPSSGTNWPYDNKSNVLEWYQKVPASANGFNGSLIVYYYDSGTLLGSTTLATGGVGNIPSGNTSAIGWTKNQILLPNTNPKATTYGLEFRQAANSQTWKIAGLRVY